MRVHLIPVSLWCIAVSSAQIPGTFAATGSMITARFRHTATVLPGGKVLIAGGNISCALGSPCIPATNGELYDPASGVFSALGTMNTIQPVGGILLSNGKVLFAEGYTAGARARIELFDPSNGEFRIAGASTSLRAVSSAALLNDGRVFMTGGGGAEIYDPVANAFTPITTWPVNIEYAEVLAVLPDNRVLLDTPAVFDPVSGTLTKQGPWAFNDTPPANLLMDGIVLVTGGNTDGGNVNWANLFAAPDGTFSRTGNMSYVRDAHTSTLLPSGEVLVAGGATSYNPTTRADNVTDSAEIYDPATGTFSLTGSMTTPRLGHTGVLLNDGRVLITGGQQTSPPEGMLRFFDGISNAELYTPAKLIPAPVLFSLSGDGYGQGAIWHASTGEIASTRSPASAGEILSMYTTSLTENGVIAPQVSVDGRAAQLLYFGVAPGYPGYYQVNFRVPGGISPGSAVPVRLTYLGRPSNETTIAVQ
jgi:hypothetical protein